MSESSLTIRLAVDSDQKYLVDWLLQPGVLEWFPLADLREVEDAARIWVGYNKYGAVLTALWDSVPCGIANLYLQPYKKLAHQCLFAIIVDEKVREKESGQNFSKNSWPWQKSASISNSSIWKSTRAIRRSAFMKGLGSRCMERSAIS